MIKTSWDFLSHNCSDGSKISTNIEIYKVKKKRIKESYNIIREYIEQKSKHCCYRGG